MSDDQGGRGPAAPASARALVAAAVESTSALAGWLLAPEGDGLVVVTAHGGSPEWASSLVGRHLELDGATAALVIQSSQPVALQPGSTSLHDATSLALLGRDPISLVCVPCTAGDGVAGALQVVDRTDGGPFDFDSVELASLLGGIAGAMLAEGAPAGRAPNERSLPSPEQLGAQLAQLHEIDRERYAAVASIVEALLR